MYALVFCAGVVGCVDGCHIPIAAPHRDAASYVNRKGFHSVVLQAVCNHNMQFTDCYAGEVGSVHDACVLRRSELFRKLQPPSGHFTAGTHILGDPAYPLLEHLITPFKDTGRLSRRELAFNAKLSGARCTIERSFALLKGRFRRLKMLNMSLVKHIPSVIVACCVLHNVCIEMNDAVECEPLETDSDDIFHTTAADSRAAYRAGLAKRNRLADMFMTR